MTVANFTPIEQSEGDGVVTNFAFSFQVFDAAWVVVAVTDLASPPVTTTLVLGVDYTVTLNTPLDENGQPTTTASQPVDGTVVTTVPVPDGYTLTINRATPLEQSMYYSRTGPFPAKSHEGALDRLTMMMQELSSFGGESGGGEGAVFSVFNRTGNVVRVSGDYAASLVTNDSNVSGNTVKNALDAIKAVQDDGAPNNSIGNEELEPVAKYTMKANITSGTTNPQDVSKGSMPAHGTPVSADYCIGWRNDNDQLVKFTLTDMFNNIPAGSIGTTQLADLSVTSGKLGDNAVTTGKINNGAVTNEKLADVAQNVIKGRYTNGTGVQEDINRATFTALHTYEAGDGILGWHTDGTMILLDPTTAISGLDPTANEEISGKWTFTNGLIANIISGKPNPNIAGATSVGMQADYTFMQGIEELLLAAPSMTDNANVSIGAVDPTTGLAALVFTKPTEAYSVEDTDANDFKLSLTNALVPGIEITISNGGNGIPAGSTINVLAVVESTNRQDVITMELVVDDNIGSGIEIINTTTDGTSSKSVVGSISTVTPYPDGTTLKLQARHSDAGGGNDGWIRGTTTPTKVSVFVPASGSGETNTASNIGDGVSNTPSNTADIFARKTGVNLEMRNLVSTDDTVQISLTGTVGNQSVNLRATPAAASGEANDGANLSNGVQVFAQKTLLDLQFRTIKATLNSLVDAKFAWAQSTDELNLNLDDTGYGKLGTAASWTAAQNFSNTTILVAEPTLDGHPITKLYFDTNKGEKNTASSLGGTSLVGTKDGVVLPFRGLIAGTNVSFASDTNTITINFDNPGTFGNTTGPTTHTDGNIATYDGVGGAGSTIKDSGIAVADLATVSSLSTVDGKTATNAANITTNTANIGTNTTNIGINASAITALQGNIIPKGTDNEKTNVKISVVNTLPGTPDADTLYFVIT